MKFHFDQWKRKRDAQIQKLNGAYERNWAKEGIELVRGKATFVGPKEIEVELKDGNGKAAYTAPHILIATGGHPVLPKGTEGAEHGITSDGFFDIEQLPKKMAIVGAGYIAVEMAGMLNAIGVEIHLFIRHQTFLRNFDPMIQQTMTKAYEDAGVRVHKNFKSFKTVERLDSTSSDGAAHESVGSAPSPDKRLKVTDEDGNLFEFNELLWAVGRAPEVEALNLEKAGKVETTEKGHIEVDEFQNTSVEGIYAIGDVTGQVELTPGKTKNRTLQGYRISCTG